MGTSWGSPCSMLTVCDSRWFNAMHRSPGPRSSPCQGALMESNEHEVFPVSILDSNAPLTVMEPHRLSGTFNTNTNHPYYEESGESVGSCCREISDVSLI